ncbi:hypothetical protein AB0H43_02385 [Hamadaea sp. NPDC050747]|uniref:hypothetical protein n=1 Tax=Hamadaea sp. NPDC050747 TaxID=3155789 RepID=UPI0033EA65FC
MWIRRALSAAAIGVLAVVGPGGAAYAAAPQADLAIKVAAQGHAALGKTATIVVETHNYGPEATLGGTVWREVRAPGGTTFLAATERALSGNGCIWLTAHQHVRCPIQGMLYPDDDNPSGGVSFGTNLYYFEVKAKCTTPGKISLQYGDDPKTSNNSATLRVTVDGVSAATCTTKPSASPKSSASAKPRPTSAPSASASLAATEPTATASDSMAAIAESPSVEVTPMITLAGDSGGSGPWVAVAVVAAVGLVVAGAGILWRIRRRGAFSADL